MSFAKRVQRNDVATNNDGPPNAKEAKNSRITARNDDCAAEQILTVATQFAQVKRLDQVQPLDILVIVCSFLDERSRTRFACVCDTFRDASKRRGSWGSEADLSCYGTTVNDGTIRNHLSNQVLSVVDLSHCTGLTRHSLAHLSKSSACSLRSLSLRDTCFRQNVLPGLKRLNAPYLQKLDLSNNRHCVGADVFQVISRRFPKLIDLNLCDSASVSQGGVTDIHRLTLLESLNLRHCRGIETFNVDTLQCLRYLNLSGTSVDSKSMQAICKLRLTSLDVSSTYIGDAGLTYLSKCRTLACLNASFIQGATEPILLETLRCLRDRLRVLTLAGNVVSNGLLAQSWLRLRELRLSSCSLFGDAGLQAIAEGPMCETLEALSWDLSFANLHNVTDAGFACLPEFTRLSHLCISSKCDYDHPFLGISGRVLHHIAQMPALECLRFGLLRADAFADGPYLSFVAAAPRLTELDLGGSEHLLDSNLCELRTMPHLLRLGLSRCGQLTDEGIMALPSRLPNLRRISLYHTRVSRRSLIALQQMPRLEEIILDTAKLTTRLEMSHARLIKLRGS